MLNKIRQISFSRFWKNRQFRDVIYNSSNLILATLKKIVNFVMLNKIRQISF